MARAKDLQLELFASDINESHWDDLFVYYLDFRMEGVYAEVPKKPI